jgi:hypothetical protein
VILCVTAPAATLRARIEERLRHSGDASEATPGVMEELHRSAEALTPEEQPFVVSCETGASSPSACAQAVVRALAQPATAVSPESQPIGS